MQKKVVLQKVGWTTLRRSVKRKLQMIHLKQVVSELVYSCTFLLIPVDSFQVFIYAWRGYLIRKIEREKNILPVFGILSSSSSSELSLLFWIRDLSNSSRVIAFAGKAFYKKKWVLYFTSSVNVKNRYRLQNLKKMQPNFLMH